MQIDKNMEWVDKAGATYLEYLPTLFETGDQFSVPDVATIALYIERKCASCVVAKSLLTPLYEELRGAIVENLFQTDFLQYINRRNPTDLEIMHRKIVNRNILHPILKKHLVAVQEYIPYLEKERAEQNMAQKEAILKVLDQIATYIPTDKDKYEVNHAQNLKNLEQLVQQVFGQ